MSASLSAHYARGMGSLHPLAASSMAQDNSIVIPWGTLTALIVGAVLTILWIWMLIDALIRPASAWRAADRSPVVWALVLILLGWLGGLLYLTLARPSLRRAAAVPTA